MTDFRYFLALVIVLIMPVVITFWVTIHAGSKKWRKLNPEMAYSTAGFFILIVVLLCWSFRARLIGTDLGFNPLLFATGALIYLASFILWRPVKKHLDFKTFAGVPEVTNQHIELIQDGPFSVVRHPRYLMIAIGIAGWCLMSNHGGAYLTGLVSILGLYLVIWLEERDLVMRFGEAYQSYQSRVPRLLPSIEGISRFWNDNFRNQDRDSD